MYLAVSLSILAFLTSLISFFVFRSYLKRRTGMERILAEMREEVNELVKDIHAATDRDITLIEEREKKSRSLLAEIDKRLLVYVREIESRKNTVSQAVAPAASPPADTAQAYRALGKKRPPVAVPAEPPPADLPAAGSAAAEPAAKVPPPSETAPAKINELVRAGFPAPLIASRLGISIAEVEFAAALLERRAE